MNLFSNGEIQVNSEYKNVRGFPTIAVSDIQISMLLKIVKRFTYEWRKISNSSIRLKGFNNFQNFFNMAWHVKGKMLICFGVNVIVEDI